jgi:hypothetical protein
LPDSGTLFGLFSAGTCTLQPHFRARTKNHKPLTSLISFIPAVIFVVLPGADDFASHESIKIAKEYDPDGERTLGVVTKIDRVEQGTDIISKLKGEGKGHIKLKLGFVAVRNRTPQEVRDEMELSDARQKEKEFFEADGRFVPGTFGIPELITRVSAALNVILMLVFSLQRPSQQRHAYGAAACNLIV